MLSILMPMKNEALHVEEALRSVGDIKGVGFEVVVVDDGSSDNSVDVVRSLNFDFVRLIETSGVGKVAAFNLAYQHARGDYFILLAADDRLVAGLAAERIKPLLGEDVKNFAITFCKLKSFSEQSSYDGMVLPKRPDRGLESGGCMAFNKAFGDLSFPIPSMLANEDSWLMLHARYSNVRTFHVPEVGIMYRIHENNSYRRGVPFPQVNEQMWLRQRALFYFYEAYRCELSSVQQREVLVEFALQLLRYLGYSFFVLALPRSDLKKRVKFFFNSGRFLYSIRERFYKFFSGR